MSAPLWQPSPARIAGANLTAFMARVERDWGVKLTGYDAIYDWSVAELEKFWSSVWDFCGVIAETRMTARGVRARTRTPYCVSTG